MKAKLAAEGHWQSLGIMGVAEGSRASKRNFSQLHRGETPPEENMLEREVPPQAAASCRAVPDTPVGIYVQTIGRQAQSSFSYSFLSQDKKEKKALVMATHAASL